MADGHGSTRLLTDGSGAVQNAFTFDGYGNLVASNAAPQTAYLYGGERFDFDLRQYYLRARYYNPTVGRFGAMDQVDGTPNDPLSLHKYAYTQNNPVNGRDPSGNETLVSMSFAMTIADIVEVAMDFHTIWTAGKMLTEYAAANESLDQMENQPAMPGADTATIIVHGVMFHTNGWSGPWVGSFQNKLKSRGGLDSQDFYEFDWGGFSFAGFGFYPIPIVHTMALLHLKAAEEIVSMKGYEKMNLISHSWGTTLTYDLQNISDIEIHDWVTMGSPLKQTTTKPIHLTGNWINYYSRYDPVMHYEIYPPFPSFFEMAWAVHKDVNGGPGLKGDDNIPKSFNIPFEMGKSGFDEHSAYWDYDPLLDNLNKQLQ